MAEGWRRRIILLLILSLIFWFGSNLQQQLGLSFSMEGLEAFRAWVEDLGAWGPLVFLSLMVFRLFVGLTSHIVLIVGGLVFGVAGGILWGGLGLMLSAMVLFILARLLGADWVQRRFGDQYLAMVGRIKRVGLAAILVITAHPIGPLTPTHLAAGVINFSFWQFSVVVGVAGLVRAAPYAILGTAVLELSPAQLLAVTLGLALLVFLPLAIPSVRQWIWNTENRENSHED